VAKVPAETPMPLVATASRVTATVAMRLRAMAARRAGTPMVGTPRLARRRVALRRVSTSWVATRRLVELARVAKVRVELAKATPPVRMLLPVMLQLMKKSA